MSQQSSNTMDEIHSFLHFRGGNFGFPANDALYHIQVWFICISAQALTYFWLSSGSLLPDFRVSMSLAAIAITSVFFVLASRGANSPSRGEPVFAFGRSRATMCGDLGFGFVRLVWVAILGYVVLELRTTTTSQGSTVVTVVVPSYAGWLALGYGLVLLAAVICYKFAANVERQSRFRRDN